MAGASREGEAAVSEVKRMWEGGPLRNFSETRMNGWISAHHGGFLGPYACEECRETTDGVYRTDGGWLGGCCWDASSRRRRALAVHQDERSDRQGALPL